MNVPAWVAYMQALSVPLVATLGAWIAYQQMRIARSKLRHDLWDRRYGIYAAVIRIIELAKTRELKDEHLQGFVENTSGALFLFDQHAVIAILGVYAEARRALGHGLTSYADRPEEEQRAQRDKQIAEAFSTLERRRQSISDTFRPFLKIDRLL